MNLADMTVEEMAKELNIQGYKAKQLYKWIRRGETDIDKMTDLPLSLR